MKQKVYVKFKGMTNKWYPSSKSEVAALTARGERFEVKVASPPKKVVRKPAKSLRPRRKSSMYDLW